MKVKMVLTFCALLMSVSANAKSPVISKTASTCSYPADPINWIMAYCGFLSETDDEIAIQDSDCFKKASPDLDAKMDACAIKKKYKTKKCELLIKEKLTDQKIIEDCLKDVSVKPFFAGG